ncbi:VanZ family protein [Clavibacter michiganensis]|uniref:VanZ family protein n=1 Tax=Clavibacter michiganensis TaxID=28447 RepID=UPI000CE86886|nr:VanZ family protein [Clavibacter michiganensis]PPF56425.1 VanZ family protein [Clavibacter michiganensis]
MPWLAFAVLVGVIVFAPLAGIRLARRRRITAVLLIAALLGALALTLYPEGDRSSSVACNVGLPYLSPTAVESTANILLFVPIAFLASLLWRRPLLAILGTVVLSALIDTVQAVALSIGRACDTGDWITNTIGAILGGLLACGTLAWQRRRTRTVATGAF